EKRQAKPTGPMHEIDPEAKVGKGRASPVCFKFGPNPRCRPPANPISCDVSRRMQFDPTDGANSSPLCDFSDAVLRMQRWFLSYHSPDQALAERLKAALERKDTDARVFFAPSSLRAGGFWSRTLAEEIAQADAFILLVGEKGVGDWQELEYDEALDKR